MESGLLSSFHDDHFDGNYSKYESNLGLWSDGNDGMGLQLSETLHGILPITANDEATHFFEADIEHRIPYRFESQHDGLTETIIEMDKNEDEDYLLTNYDAADDMSDSMSPSIEIISVDPNGEFNSPVTIDDDEEDDQHAEDTDSDRCSSRNSDSSSNSSIADYESHSSDESEEEILEPVVPVRNRKPEVFQLIKIEEAIDYTSTPKKKETSLKNVSHGVQQTKRNCKHLKVETSEIDKPLEVEVADLKNFDLATYITEDDCNLLNTEVVSDVKDKMKTDVICTVSSSYNLLNVGNIKLEPKCDSDTEVIVDIETVHDEDVKPMLLRKQTVDYSSCMDVGEPVNHCEDDIKHDPSWSPNNEKASKTNKPRTNRQPKTKRSNNLILQCNRMLNSNSTPVSASNKPQVVMDRKKYGLGKGKNISMCTRPEIIDSSEESDDASRNESQEKNLSLEKKPNDINQKCAIDNKLKIKMNNPNVNSANSNPPSKIVENKMSPNLTPVSGFKREPSLPIEIKQEVKVEAELKPEQCNGENIQSKELIDNITAPPMNVEPKQSEPAPVAPVKKKLNLEEYKRRRENQLIGDTKIKKTIPCNPMPLSVGTKTQKDEPKKLNSGTKENIPTQNDRRDKPQPMYMENGKEFYDPILEAKKKVLRMQELKKAAQSKRIDSTVSAKVGPIMPILPMEQICGFKAQNEGANKLNPEYEEIIIVSASCNTEITLPPVFEKLDPSAVNNRNDNPLSVVIKSSSLLSNINNTINKTSVVKISSNSLLSSIQDVVLKQSTTTLLNGNQPPQKSPNVGVSPPSQFSPQKPEMSHTEQANSLTTNDNKTQHGKESEHGEDKIIMHLRKDRIRKKTFSISIQTDDLPQFPPLLHLSDKYSSGQSANTKKRKRHYRSRRDSSASSVDNDDYRSSSRSHIRYRSVSSHGTNRSVSPRSSRYSYSSGHRTASPYHKVRRRSSRSSSRTKYASDSSDSGRRSRSRERRTRRYSSSHSSSSSSTSSDSSSRSRSRSRSPRSRSRSRSRYSSANPRGRANYQRRNSSPAVEERRIVYVGRIERETSKEDLKRKFSAYGPIKQITVHYKDTGMKYGFVTFEKAQDAFTVIDGSAKDSRINMYDISFGGRRAFCRATYSDLDGAATNSLQDLPYPIAPRSVPFEEDSFESLLAKVKEKLSSARPSSSPAPSTGSSRCKT